MKEMWIIIRVGNQVHGISLSDRRLGEKSDGMVRREKIEI